MRILALDVGRKKIGMAVGDTEHHFAFTRPALLVDSWDGAWVELDRVLSDERIEQIVIGWPMNTDGTVGPQAEEVANFQQQLAARTSLPIDRRDERWTSTAVQREQQQAGRTLARGEEDSLAAQLLLESYINERSL